MTNNNTYSWTNYSTDITKAVLPWIVFGCLAFVVFSIAIVLRFFRCSMCGKLMKKCGARIKLLCVVLSFLITFLGLISCCFVIFHSDLTFQGYQQVQCASGRIPFTLEKGVSQENWTGLSFLLQDFSEVSNAFSNYYQNSTYSLWNNTQWLSPLSFEQTLTNFYNEFSNSSVTSPNPWTQQSIPTQYTSLLGPLNLSISYLGLINTEFDVKILPIISVMQSMSNVTVNFISLLNPTQQVLANSIVNVSTYISGIEVIRRNVDSWVVNNQEKIVQSWEGFTFGVVGWGWFLCVGVLITVYSKAMNKPKMAHGLCCFWFFTGLFAVVGFLASAGTLATGLITNDGCGLLDDLFTPQGIYKYDVIVPQNVSDFINLCLNLNGDLATSLSMTGLLQFFNQLHYFNTTLSSFNLNNSTANFQSIEKNQQILQFPIDYFSVPNSSVPEGDGPRFNLDFLNKLTNNNSIGNFQSTCGESQTQDLWSFSLDRCEGYEYINGIETVQRLGQKSCLLFEDWDQASVKARYVDYLHCTYFDNYTDSILSFTASLRNYQLNVNSLYVNLTNGLTLVNNSIFEIVQQLMQKNADISTYFQDKYQISSIMSTAFGPTPMVNGLNCSYLKSYSSTLKSSICSNSLSNIYQVFIFIFMLSFCMISLELINLYLSRALL